MTGVAIVILNFNGAKYLKKFLPSVIDHSKGSHIIVADNGSTDNSVEILRTSFSEVDILELEENYGFSEGYNQALRQIDADIFVLLNSDVEVTENWLESPVSILKAENSVAAVQPKILSYNSRETFEYAGAGGGFVDKYGYPFCRGRLFNTLEKDHGQYDNRTEVFWASGACMFIRSDLYKKAGGLDPDFFAHMEEIDLCWRLKAMGYKIFYTGESKVYHVGGGTLEHSHPRKTYLNFRNGLTLLLKNLPSKKLLYIVPVRIFLDWIALIKFLFFDSPSHSLAVLKAHGDFLLGMGKNFRKRKEVKKLIKKYPALYKKSIIKEYFLRGRKTFNSLEQN